MKNLIFLLILLISLSCTKKKQNYENMYLQGDTLFVDSVYTEKMSLDEISQRYIDTNNPMYFDKLTSKLHFEQLLIYYLISANKYNDTSNYYIFYELFYMHFPVKYFEGEQPNSGFNLINLDSLDNISKSQVMTFLKNASQSENIFAISELEDYYRLGIGIEKNIDKADELNKKIKNIISHSLKAKNIEEQNMRHLGYQIKIKNISQVKSIEEDGFFEMDIPAFGCEDEYKKICKYGDVKAYNRTKNFYKTHGREYEVLFFSIVMANKYNNLQACKDVYYCFWHAFNQGKEAELWDMTRFDIKSKEFALFYLKKAALNGDNEAKDILFKQF